MPLGFFIFGGFYLLFCSVRFYLVGFCFFLLLSTFLLICLMVWESFRGQWLSIAVWLLLSPFVLLCSTKKCHQNGWLHPIRHTHTHTRISSSAWLSFWFGFCFIVFFLVAFDSTRGPNCSIQFVWLKMKREIESKRLPKISATIQRRSMWYVCSCVGVCWAEKDSIFVSINLLSLFYMCKIASGRAKFEKRNARRWKKWAMSTDSSLAYNAGFRRDCHNFRQNFFIFIHILQYTYNSFVWLADSVRVSCAHLLGPE